jgi:hypothetical protein
LLFRHCWVVSQFRCFAVIKQQAESRRKSPQILECQWTSIVARLGVLPETGDPSSDMSLEGIHPSMLLSTISQFPPLFLDPPMKSLQTQLQSQGRWRLSCECIPADSEKRLFTGITGRGKGLKTF